MIRLALWTLLTIGVWLSSGAYAAPITCPGLGASPDRQATVAPAIGCRYGTGNPSASDIMGDYPTDPWTEVGEVEGADGASGSLSNEYLTVVLDSGSTWGSIPVEGTFSIAADFWSMFEEAVLSIHIGNGNGDPDYWAFLIEQGATKGTFLVQCVVAGCTGGGLSNMKLWGRGEVVPEPGTLALLGAGLIGLGLVRRRRSRV